jgi:K+-sensing histidine kinase KdpD
VLQSAAQKRAERLRDEAVMQISAELAAPISGILGVAATMRRETPSLHTEHVFANACRLNESVVRLGQMAAAHAED